MAFQVRRVITGHDNNGKAIAKIDEVVTNVREGRPGAMAHAIWTTEGFPVNNDSQEDAGKRPVQTTLPGGTIFRVSLPASDGVRAIDSGKPRAPLKTMPPAPMSGRARVLVIDDDPGVASTLRAMLEAHHEVQSVEQAREGLRILLGADEFDVVFCDLIMPEISGVDLYYSVELNRPERAERLVFMTGGVFTPEAERFLASVANPRVEKPFSLARVEQLLAQAVGRRAPLTPRSDETPRG